MPPIAPWEEIDQEYQDEQEFSTPVITAPPPAIPARTVAPAPGAAPVVQPFLSPQELEQRAVMRRLQYQIQDLPLAEAEQAVSTALKFQAIRGYQRDLQEGKDPAVALTRWAPIMFSQPKAATLGQAANLVRASQQDKYMDVGGVGYLMRGGKAIPLTPPKVEKPPQTYLTVATDPNNPFTGQIRIPVATNDPLVMEAMKRARGAEETAPPPPKPGLFTKEAWPRLFGRPQGTPQGPSAAPPVPTVAPPAPVATQATPRPPSPIRAKTPEEKLEQAKELRKLHPDWTKQQILDAVNQ